MSCTPVSDVSNVVIRGFLVICTMTGALELAWLVYANDPTNSSEQHELPTGEALS